MITPRLCQVTRVTIYTSTPYFIHKITKSKARAPSLVCKAWYKGEGTICAIPYTTVKGAQR
jgi:hypothetical protein